MKDQRPADTCRSYRSLIELWTAFYKPVASNEPPAILGVPWNNAPPVGWLASPNGAKAAFCAPVTIDVAVLADLGARHSSEAVPQ